MDERTRFSRDDQVFGADNEKIGRVSEIGPTYFHVATGFLGLGKDYYVPFEAVDHVEDSHIYLNVTKEDFSARGWEHPPAEPVATAPTSTTPGMYGTMPSATATTGTAQPEPRTSLLPEDVLEHRLCDFDGVELGMVDDVSPNFVHVRTEVGGLGPDFYPPLTAVSHCDENCCYLNMPLSELRTMGWNRSPSQPNPEVTPHGLENVEVSPPSAASPYEEDAALIERTPLSEGPDPATESVPPEEFDAEERPPLKQRRVGD